MSHTGEKAQSAKLTLRIKKSIVTWAASLVKADSRLSDPAAQWENPCHAEPEDFKTSSALPWPQHVRLLEDLAQPKKVSYLNVLTLSTCSSWLLPHLPSATVSLDLFLTSLKRTDWCMSIYSVCLPVADILQLLDSLYRQHFAVYMSPNN